MFNDRYDAAYQLTPYLSKYTDRNDVVIIAIPRGGLQLGAVLSEALHAPLDVIFVKKIGAPNQPEFAIGAVSKNDVIVDAQFNTPALQSYIRAQTELIRKTIDERYERYKDGKPPINLQDKIVIVTDDGLATGRTMLLTLQLIANQAPKKIIVAVPVAPPDTLKEVSKHADEVVCLMSPEMFFGVGSFYRNFAQVSDDEAIALLKQAERSI